MSYTECQSYARLLMLEQSCLGCVILRDQMYQLVYYPHYVDQLVLHDLGECVIGWEQLTDGQTGQRYDIWSPTVYTIEQVIRNYPGLARSIQSARLAVGRVP